MNEAELEAWLLARLPIDLVASAPQLLTYDDELVIMLLVLVVGTALDLAPTILILTPVLMPIIREADIDPIYFGVLFVMNNCVGLITPPVGVVLNVVGSVARVPLGQVIVGVWPFLIAQVLLIFLLVLFPQIVLVPLGWLY